MTTMFSRAGGASRGVIDACVLANYAVINLLLTLAKIGGAPLFPLWSVQILEEVHRTHTQRLRWKTRIADSFRGELLRKFPASLISGYERWISQCTNHEKDRHVLAAAIEGEAQLILTYNLRDFGEEHLARWGLRGLHPQDYLQGLQEWQPNKVTDALRVLAGKDSRKLGRPVTEADVLRGLAPFMPRFAEPLIAKLEANELR